MTPFEEKVARGGGAAIQEASRFLMKQGPVWESLGRIASKLNELNIPYAVAGGMALVAHGYERTTVDVDVLVTAEGLKAVHQALDGLGYLPPFQGSKQLRDVETSVRIEFLLTGQFPGDGKPKPVSFPNPDDVAVVIEGVRYVGLAPLVEMKLASGMTNAARLKDLADVQELIKILKLPKEFGGKLNVYVRGKFEELFEAVAQDPIGDH